MEKGAANEEMRSSIFKGRPFVVKFWVPYKNGETSKGPRMDPSPYLKESKIDY